MTSQRLAAEVAGLAYENLISASKTWALAATGGETWQDNGLVVASSGVPLRSFNRAYFTGPAGSAVLARFLTYIDGRGVPFRISAPESIEIDATLTEAGLEPSGGIPSLLLDDVSISPPRLEALRIERVTDAARLRDHAAVVAAAFDWHPDTLGRVFTERLLSVDSWRGFVGYVDGRAVASSQLFVHQHVAGIYYVGTLDSHRKRGFGEAMTAHAVHAGAAAGCSMASLQASPMGLPIYQRMGFRQVDYYRTYTPGE